MEIKIYYSERNNIPQSGIMYELACQVGKLYSKNINNMERIKEDSLPLLTFLNCVKTIVEMLENDTIPSQLVNTIWDDLKPLNINGCSEDYHVNRWYEATIIFGGVYFVISKNAEPDKELMVALENKAAYDDTSKRHFSFFKNTIHTVDEQNDNEKEYANEKLTILNNRIDGFSDEMKLKEYERAIEKEQDLDTHNYSYLKSLNIYADTIRKRLTKKELQESTLPQTKETNDSTQIDFLDFMKTTSDVFPENAKVVFDAIGYYLYNKQGNNLEKFNNNKEMLLNKISNNKSVPQSKFVIGEGHIGDLAKIIQTLCDCNIIIKKDGSCAKPVKDVGILIGSLFGEEYKNWSQTLKSAFDQSNCLEIFYSLETAAKTYKNKKNR